MRKQLIPFTQVNITSVAIWQTIYAFCGSSSLDFDWSRV